MFGSFAISGRIAARLAGMVPNPVYYQAHPQDRNLRHRTRIIRRNMHTAQIP